MKKLILAASIAGTVFAGSAFAQANSPEFTGTQPGIVNPQYGGQIYGNSGWTPDQAYGGSGYYGNALPQILSDGRYVVVPRSSQRYDRNSRDRDGDGVRNSRDRYPDNPRRR